MSNGNLIAILGDQLSMNISSLKAADISSDCIVMAEVAVEATYVKHHKKKIIFVFSAMRHFAEQLQAAGWSVDYIRIDDPSNTGSLTGEIERACKHHTPQRVVVTEPGEWRVRADMMTWADRLQAPVDILDDDRFLCPHDEFANWAAGRKQFRMEYFYREMRRKTGLLMDGDQPLGGKWNLDSENRKPARHDLFLPQPLCFEPDNSTQNVIDLVRELFADHFGDAVPFWFAVTREQAEAAFEHFVCVALAHFGDYQDAMLAGESFLYHSVVSPYVNAGLLDPLQVCQRVDAEYRAGGVPLNAAEGFIRQIIGWREYVRGIYWLKMPDYGELHHLEASRPLPDFYWSGQTDMACLNQAIMQTKEQAYAHHIQRLMITGNFAMLAGVAPDEVHQWYLAVYADAYEWVELPNTLGMSQFADGGLLGSKPYAAGGNYINKMSDYCSGCRYDVKSKSGEDACPFNYLYWDFLARHQAQLGSNPRLAPVYRTWERLSKEQREAYRTSAAHFLAEL